MNVLFGAELVTRAGQIAETAHAGQMYGDRPYIVHPREVADLARQLGYNDDVVAGSLLHDVVEDNTSWTPHGLLLQGIPGHVVDGVRAVTWDGKGTAADKLIRAKSHPIGHVVKFCDASRNFANTVGNPAELGPERARRYATRYATYLGELAINLPSPEEIVRFCSLQTRRAA